MLNILSVFKKNKKLNKKSKNMSTSQTLIKYLQIQKKNLDDLYKEVDSKTRAILDYSKLLPEDKVHLQWGLAHLHTSLCEFERDIDRHIKILEKDKDAN